MALAVGCANASTRSELPPSVTTCRRQPNFDASVQHRRPTAHRTIRTTQGLQLTNRFRGSWRAQGSKVLRRGAASPKLGSRQRRDCMWRQRCLTPLTSRQRSTARRTVGQGNRRKNRHLGWPCASCAGSAWRTLCQLPCPCSRSANSSTLALPGAGSGQQRESQDLELRGCNWHRIGLIQPDFTFLYASTI